MPALYHVYLLLKVVNYYGVLSKLVMDFQKNWIGMGEWVRFIIDIIVDISAIAVMF